MIMRKERGDEIPTLRVKAKDCTCNRVYRIVLLEMIFVCYPFSLLRFGLIPSRQPAIGPIIVDIQG